MSGFFQDNFSTTAPGGLAVPMRWTESSLEEGGTIATDKTSAAVAEANRSPARATAATAATEHPPTFDNPGSCVAVDDCNTQSIDPVPAGLPPMCRNTRTKPDRIWSPPYFLVQSLLELGRSTTIRECGT